MRSIVIYTVCLLVAVCIGSAARAQPNIFNQVQNGMSQMGNGGSSGDSLRHRDRNEDSITIYFRYLDTAGRYRIDSSVTDFYRRFPIPFRHQWLGNTGGPSQPMLFTPRIASGFDPGFHAYDAYRYRVEDARFFSTTKPFTEIGYSLGSKVQQIVDILHTQNLKPYWNMSLQYRLINSQGTFNNQNTNHNNYQITSWYQSPNKRYNNYGVIIGNNIQASENGGILTDTNYLDNPQFTDRVGIPTRLSSGTSRGGSVFGNTKVSTGNKYGEFRFLLRQQYDLGRKDSLVTDSTVIPLFYPRLRIEHTLSYGSGKYNFVDAVADSAFYHDAYGLQFRGDTALSFRDSWSDFTNDLSLYQFPVADNQNQYVRVGAAVQLLTGHVRETLHYTNTWLHGEYRNRTRNQKWDLSASGALWLTGYNRGDFNAQASLKRVLGPKAGSFRIGGSLSSRSPSFAYDARSNFYFDAQKTFLKENSTRAYAFLYNQRFRAELGAEYMLLTNYLYMTGYRTMEQETGLFNLLRVQGRKTFQLRRRISLDAEVYLQQGAGSAALHVPLFFSVARLAYQGNLGFRNLTLAVGVEGRYASPYKADNYSPVIGQFSYQDSTQIANRPDINAFLNFRIRGFKLFFRAENLNTLRFRSPGGFREHNFAAPGYPYPGLVIRFGVYWGFIN